MKQPTTEDIIQSAMIAFGRSRDEICNNIRKRPNVNYRQVVQYMCCRLKTDILEQIALKTGITNHASVLHSYKLIKNEVEIYGDVAERVHKLEVTMFYRNLDSGDQIPKAPFVDRHDPDLRDRQENHHGQIRVKITDTTTGVVADVKSQKEASYLTGVSLSSLSHYGRYSRRIIKGFLFEYG